MILLTSLLIAAATLAACGDPQPSDIGGSLDDIVWRLTGATIDGSAVEPIAGAPVTITFRTDGTVGGTAACNSYSGPAIIDVPSLTFPGPLAQTEMYCMDDAVMDLESIYLAALQRVTAFTSGIEILVLSGPGVELRFEVQAPEPSAALIGTQWVLETLQRGETASTPVAPAPITFNADGTVSGSGGCNGFSGSYATDTGFGSMMSTLMACEQPIMDQESFVLSILTPDSTITIDGPVMTIADLEGNALIYRAG